jgi:bicarbonate transport system ATP-binding protein
MPPLIPIPVLEITDVSKWFPTANGDLRVLDHVSLKLSAGELVSIMGHSGCGKSTLLDIVAGLSEASEGGVVVDGREALTPGPDRMVVFQHDALLPWLTALDNVRLAVDGARARDLGRPLFAGRSRAWRRQRAREKLELVGLGHALDKYPGQMSGGMRQRVAIARALAVEPRMLILDEPFAALDAITREEMQDELLSIWSRTQTTGLMVTHEIDEAILLSDRIVLMTNGPAATVGEVLAVPLARPRSRARLMESPQYFKLRNHILRFLHQRFAQDDGAVAPLQATG